MVLEQDSLVNWYLYIQFLYLIKTMDISSVNYMKEVLSYIMKHNYIKN